MKATTSFPRHLQAVAPSKAVSDAEILLAWEENDPRFGAMMYDHLIRTIDGTLFRILGQRVSEHDDLVQSTFEQILLTLEKRKFRGACSLQSWSGAIATRVALNAIRSRKTIRKYFSSQDDLVGGAVAQAPDADRLNESRERLRDVRREIGRMSKTRAEAVILHDVLGHSLAEVAAMTGVTVVAAQSRLVRGRKELHQRLAGSDVVGGAEQ